MPTSPMKTRPGRASRGTARGTPAPEPHRRRDEERADRDRGEGRVAPSREALSQEDEREQDREQGLCVLEEGRVRRLRPLEAVEVEDRRDDGPREGRGHEEPHLPPREGPAA